MTHQRSCGDTCPLCEYDYNKDAVYDAAMAVRETTKVTKRGIIFDYGKMLALIEACRRAKEGK